VIDELVKQYNCLLKLVVESYDHDKESDNFFRIFNACFELADFIVQVQSDNYVDEYELETKSSFYVLKSISDLIDKSKDEWLVKTLRYSAQHGGRLRGSFNLIDDFLETEEGTFEMLKSPTFVKNLSLLRS
jgi:hypothetical protein